MSIPLTSGPRTIAGPATWPRALPATGAKSFASSRIEFGEKVTVSSPVGASERVSSVVSSTHVAHAGIVGLALRCVIPAGKHEK